MHVYIYIFVCIYIYIHTYIFIYIHIYLAKLPSQCYRGTSLIINTPLLGPYGRTLPMVVLGGGV